MDNKIIEYISDIDNTSYEKFKENSNIEKMEYSFNDYDISWLDSLEEYLPFLNNIVTKNYAKSNVILKSYENRFIKTLIYQIYNFLLNEKDKIEKIKGNCKIVNSKINTIVDSEEIEIEIKVKTKNNNNNDNILERLKIVLDIVTSLINSEFIKSLDDLSIITEEIDKTEVFEQELNYRKAWELYNILIKYMDNNLDDNSIIENKILTASFLEYQLTKNYNIDKLENNIYKEFIEKLIEKMVLEYSIDEKSFKKMITKKFEEEYNKKKSREKNIQNIFIKNIDNYNKMVKDAMRALKG